MRLPLLLASTALLSSLLSAQSAPCLSYNDSNTTVSNLITARPFGGATDWAWKFTPTANMSIHGIKLFTNNSFTAGFMKLAIFSDDASAGAPGKKLGEGTFAAPKMAAASWVGTNLDQVVSLNANTDYWVVWTEIGWSTVPMEPGGATGLSSMRRVGTAAWAAGSATQALKCRLFCGPIDVKGVTPFGDSCAGSQTGLGTSFTNTVPAVGNADFRLEGTGLPPSAAAFLAFGITPNWPSIQLGAVAPGCAINTDIVMTVTGQTGSGDVRATTAAGHVSFALPIPNTPSLVGVYVAMQIAAADATSPNAMPLVFTNATRIIVQ